MKLPTLDSARLLVFVIFVQGVTFASAQAPVQAWVQHYAPNTNGALARYIGLDTNGNVFVSGTAGNGSNFGFATVAYSNTGTPLWTNRYDAGLRSASPASLAIGRDGNIFVTGSTYMQPSDPERSPFGFKFATVAYSGSGAALWTNSFSEGGGDARAGRIVVGQSGTVFVTGLSTPSNSLWKMTTVAYSSAGVLLWTNHYGSTNPNSPSSSSGIAVDDKENVFVAGSAYEADNRSHYALVAYSGAGVPLWTNQYIGPINDFASAVAVDGSGNVFLTGQAFGTNSVCDYLTVAYSGGGVPLWTNRYGTDYDSTPYAITVDTNGTVFVSGTSSSAPGFTDFATTIAYSAAGSPLWTNRYDSPAPGRDAAVAVAADGRGHVVVICESDSVNSDYITIWYSTSGTPLWTNRYDGPEHVNDGANALAVDAAGNVFVTGRSWNGTNYEFATIKYAILEPIPLQAQRVGDQIVLSWTNAAFGLQAAPGLSDVFTNVPDATSPYTNGTAGESQFFRLISM